MLTMAQALRLLRQNNLYGVYLKDQWGRWHWHSLKNLTDKYNLKKIYVTQIEVYFSISDGSFNGFKLHTKHPEKFHI